jgi:hypothetical protein
MTWHPGEIYKASEKIHHALSEAMKELPRESLQFLKFRACDPIIPHKAAEVLNSRELVIWPEDVERPPRARRLLPESLRDRWRIRSVERDRLAESWSEGVRGKATDLHRHGWSLPTLVAELGIGFAMPKAWVLASGFARVTSRPVRSLTCGKACRKSARAFLPNSSNPSAQGSSGVRTSVRATFLRRFGLGRHARPPLCHPA